VIRSKTSLAAGALLLLGLTGCGPAAAQNPTATPAASADFFEPAVGTPVPIPGVELFPGLSREHTTEPVDYAQSPPVGGPHDPAWQRCLVYDAPIRNEHAVHSLEHGAVWIAYRSDLPDADREALEEIGDGQPYLLVSPYPGLEEPVVLSAWGAQLRLEDVADPRIEEFIDRYAGNGPEPGAPCDSGVEETEGAG
jgi:hypothetical protein